MSAVTETPTGTRSLVLTGAATGAAVELAVSLVYVLIRVGFHIAGTYTLPAGATTLPSPDSPDRIFGVYVIGGMLTLAPSLLAGGLFGALLGAVLNRSKRHQSILGSWLTGSLLAFAVVAVVNAMVLGRHRRQPLTFGEWAPLLGYPSIIFILIFGGLGVWLFLSSPESRVQPGFLNE